MLGICRRTARDWVVRSGCEIVRAPLARNSMRSSPAYVTTAQAVQVIDRMLPRKLDAQANARARRAVWQAAADLKESTRNIKHSGTPGGTGSGDPPPETGTSLRLPGDHGGGF
jgi:hypothetical protein